LIIGEENPENPLDSKIFADIALDFPQKECLIRFKSKCKEKAEDIKANFQPRASGAKMLIVLIQERPLSCFRGA
jgi:hypothetical protein